MSWATCIIASIDIHSNKQQSPSPTLELIGPKPSEKPDRKLKTIDSADVKPTSEVGQVPTSAGNAANRVAVNHPWRETQECYMGSGATLVDGVRRWFQRRTSTTSSSKPINNPNPNPNRNSNNHDYNDSDLSAQSSTGLQKEEEDDLLQFQVEEDFDISGLKLIRVPKRAHHFKAAHNPPPPIMEKKVPF